MPISSLTAIVGIPEGSEATPGLFNSRFSQLQQNLQELNTQAIGLLSGFVSGGVGSPESVQTGNPGFIYEQSDATVSEHPMWIKYTGSGTTGWRGFAGFKGLGADSYAIGRGAGAAGENSMALGRSSAAGGSASQGWGYLAAAGLDSDIAIGPNSRTSGPNAAAIGLNAFAGFINAGALGSAATSNATGGWAFGAGTQSSHQSALVFSATGGVSRNPHEMVMDYPVSSFSGAIGILRNDTYNWTDYLVLSDSSSTAYIGYASSAGGLAFRPPEDAQGGTHLFYDSTGLNLVFRISASTVSTAGNTVINQGPNDGEIIAMKSSDVAHGMTTRTETDTYGEIRKQSATSGGVRIGGHSSLNASRAIELSCEAGSGDTLKTNAAGGALYVNANKANGTGLQVLGANENIAAFANGGTTRFILDAEGDSHQDVGTAWTNFDTHDDIALLNQLSAHVTRSDDPLRENFSGWLSSSRTELESLRLVSFDPTGRPFLNLSRLAMLHTGALRQLGEKLARLDAQMSRLLPGSA